MLGIEEGAVRRIGARPHKAVAPEMAVSDLLRLFALDERDGYPVERDGKLVGSVSKSDIRRSFSLSSQDPVPDCARTMGTTVDEIMSRGVIDNGASATGRPPKRCA